MNKIALIYAILRLMTNQWLMVQSYREHKVHNIVLYPDKHSWCKTTIIKQVISYPGCTSVEINNNVCVGACFSYSIPQTEPSDPGEVIVPYCDSCQPSETTWHQITLQCNADNADTAHQMIKNVQIIQNCSCTPCEKDSLRMTKFPDNNDDLSLQTNVDSEILNALHVRNESNANDHVDGEHWKKIHSLLNQEIVNTLRNIQVNNTEQDKEKLFELFNIVQEPHKHKVKTKNIIEFIEALPQNATDLNAQLLAEILLKYEKNQKAKIYDTNVGSLETFDPEAIVAGDRDREQDDSSASSDKSPLDLTIPAWMHNVLNSKSEQTDASNGDGVSGGGVRSAASHHGHEHRQHKENFDSSTASTGHHEEHPAEDNHDVAAAGGVADDDEVKHHHAQHTHNHPHHHVNDNIVAHGHLTRGPHGALVIEPDRIHEKIVDVNAHELKPNHAGTLLSYHSHSSGSDSQK